MEVQLVQIGKSKGLILPDNIINNLGYFDKIDIVIEQNKIVLKPKYIPRKGWDDAFKLMHSNGDDELLIDDVFLDEDIS